MPTRIFPFNTQFWSSDPNSLVGGIYYDEVSGLIPGDEEFKSSILTLMEADAQLGVLPYDLTCEDKSDFVDGYNAAIGSGDVLSPFFGYLSSTAYRTDMTFSPAMGNANFAPHMGLPPNPNEGPKTIVIKYGWQCNSTGAQHYWEGIINYTGGNIITETQFMEVGTQFPVTPLGIRLLRQASGLVAGDGLAYGNISFESEISVLPIDADFAAFLFPECGIVPPDPPADNTTARFIFPGGGDVPNGVTPIVTPASKLTRALHPLYNHTHALPQPAWDNLRNVK